MKKRSGEPCDVQYVDFVVTKLIDEKGQYHEKLGIGEAKKKAQEANLDLVCFNRPDKNNIALCKIINFGKWRYAEEKKKKKQQKVGRRDTKEMRFSPDIDKHDVEHKMKQVIAFLDDNDDVILSMRLKGRQRAHYGDAEKRMNEIVDLCKDHGSVVSVKKTGSMINIRVGKLKENKE